MKCGGDRRGSVATDRVTFGLLAVNEDDQDNGTAVVSPKRLRSTRERGNEGHPDVVVAWRTMA